MSTNSPAGPQPSRRRLLQASAGALAGAAALGTAASPADGSTAAGAGTASASTTPRSAASAPGPLFQVDLTAKGTPLRHFWEPCVGGDHAKQALRRDFQDVLTRTHAELGVQSVRMHGVLAPQMSVYARGRTPSPYSFFNVHQAYDHLVASGMHPYVELSAMPEDLASGGSTVFYYDFNSSPPTSFSDWGDLIGAFAADLVTRYGLAEVRNWPFEVWNEPNIGFWSGTAQQYNQLYQAAAEAIKGVDASLMVGGPTTDGEGLSFLEGFLEFVEQNDVPIDFVSSHGYENNTSSGPLGVADIFAPTRAAIPSGLPYYVSETGPNYSNVSDENDTSYGAAFWVKTVAECDGITDVLSLWCFSDIFEEGQQSSQLFYGGYGATTMYGTPKPIYRAFQLLHGLGSRRLSAAGSNVPETLGMLAATSARGGYDLLIYNHSLPNGGTAATQQTVQIQVQGAAATHTASLTRIDATHGNTRQTWYDLGSPLYPTAAELEQITAASEVSPVPLAPAAPAGGDLTFEIVVPAEAVAALHLR